MRPEFGMGPILGNQAPVNGVWNGRLPRDLFDAILADVREDLHQENETYEHTAEVDLAMKYAALRTAQRIYVEMAGCSIDTPPSDE